MPRADIRIGISGWTYSPWRGSFYPRGLRQKDELTYAAGIFGTIEINGTFYGLQRPEAFARWAEAAPEDFVFAVKGSRYITHMRRLRDARVPLANFLASGVLRLGPKLGPLLWQLPPSQRFEPEWASGRAMRDGHFVVRQNGRARRRDVFLFFDNTDKRHAPEDARSLMRRPHLERDEPRQAA